MTTPHFIGGNALTLLTNGEEYFPALIKAIDGALHQVHLETYIFELDATGRQIADALKNAAQRGVGVHVLVDGYGSQTLPKTFIAEMLAAGVEWLIFRPAISPWTLKRVRLRRLHRKLAVVDGRIAFATGINIIDDLNPPALEAPRFDYAVTVQGPLVAEMHRAVSHLWMLTAWSQLKRRWARREKNKSQSAEFAPPHPAGKQRAALVMRDNFRHRRDIEREYLRAIGHAREEIIISNSYFLPGARFRRALVAAAARGVRVVLLLQGRVEYRLQHYATHALYGSLLDAGVEIHEYHKSFLHGKVAVIDTHWATVGSSNIDPFSLLLSREANVVAMDTAFATELRDSLNLAIKNDSTRIGRANWHNQPWLNRVLSWISYGIVRFLRGMVGYGKY